MWNNNVVYSINNIQIKANCYKNTSVKNEGVGVSLLNGNLEEHIGNKGATTQYLC